MAAVTVPKAAMVVEPAAGSGSAAVAVWVGGHGRPGKRKAGWGSFPLPTFSPPGEVLVFLHVLVF